jgi:V8-like Glu-specific endopeptidase
MCDESGQKHEHELYPPLPPRIEEVARRLAEMAVTEDNYATILETICGAIDDSQPVEQYDGTLGVTVPFVNAHQGAVGQLQWNDDLTLKYVDAGNVSGVRWCSGTLITENLFLTAGHCFDSVPRSPNNWQLPLVNGTNTVIPSSEIVTNMHVNFNYQVDANGTPRPEQRVAIAELVEHRLGQLDFAVIRLVGAPAQQFGSTVVADEDSQLQDMVCIIGHPAGQRKRIEAGPVTGLVNTQIRYNDIDTLGGNSGSAILSPAGEVVGVHTNGGCTTGGGFNFGVRISSIINASPTIRDLATRATEKERDWITALYADLLARQPDQQGLDFWVAQRQSGASTRDVVQGFLRSSEYCTIATSRIYVEILDRQPDDPGLKHWTDQLGRGVPRHDILVGFLDSPEYRNNHPVPDHFVESLYGKLLGRVSDPAGRQHWINVLDSGTSTAEVIRSFLFSPEYCTQRITELYAFLLGRGPDANGLAHWVAIMTSGTPFQEIQHGFLESPEYRARALTRFANPA